MTNDQLEAARTFTEKEVMSNAISKLRALTINKLVETSDEEMRKELEERQRLLEYESLAVLGDDQIAKSIQDKVIRLYGPMLRAEYGKE